MQIGTVVSSFLGGLRCSFSGKMHPLATVAVTLTSDQFFELFLNMAFIFGKQTEEIFANFLSVVNHLCKRHLRYAPETWYSCSAFELINESSRVGLIH